jgi:hypothetical protein
VKGVIRRKSFSRRSQGLDLQVWGTGEEGPLEGVESVSFSGPQREWLDDLEDRGAEGLD